MNKSKNDQEDKCSEDYKLVYHDNDNDDNVLSLLKKFNVKIPFLDNIIEKMLHNIMISNDLNNNEKKIIKMFINNLKHRNFAELKLLWVITFTHSVKKLIDNIQGNNFKEQLLIKGLSLIFSFLITNTSVILFTKLEDENIDDLLTNILNTYSKHVSFHLLRNIENNNDNDKNFKGDYKSNIEVVLTLNRMFIRTVYNYLRLINYMLTLYLVPTLYEKNGLTLNLFFKTTIINIYNILIFNNLFKKCEIQNKCKKNNNENIEYFFNNLDKIIEGNNGELKKELYEVNNELFKYFNKPEISKIFKYVGFQSERRRQAFLYSFYETAISLIVNNTYLLIGSNKFKVYFDDFANQKFEFKTLLKTTGNLLEVLNYKKYKVANTLPWNNDNNYEYAFTLKDVSLEYNSKNNDNLTVITNVNLNFEINKFHFIYGKSGCGKTSLLKAIIKRQPIKTGEIKFLGIHDYTYFSILKYLNYTPSDNTLFPKSLYFNLTYGIDKNVLHDKKDIIMNEIIKLMNLFELEIYIPTLKTKIATKLSKGQIQRVNIIYNILNIMFNNTKLLFLDESTSNIDDPMQRIIYNELKNLNKNYPFTLFYVSHNLSNIEYSDYSYNISPETHSVTKNKTNI